MNRKDPSAGGPGMRGRRRDEEEPDEFGNTDEFEEDEEFEDEDLDEDELEEEGDDDEDEAEYDDLDDDFDDDGEPRRGGGGRPRREWGE